MNFNSGKIFKYNGDELASIANHRYIKVDSAWQLARFTRTSSLRAIKSGVSSWGSVTGTQSGTVSPIKMAA